METTRDRAACDQNVGIIIYKGLWVRQEKHVI